MVDAAGYRARREATLGSLAHRAAEQALRSGERVELEPMTAVERKIVHVTLKDSPGVETTSEGTEPNRFVVVSPSVRVSRGTARFPETLHRSADADERPRSAGSRPSSRRPV